MGGPRLRSANIRWAGIDLLRSLVNEGLHFDIQPYLADQELDVSVRYWEGAITVTETVDDTRISGRAYVELVKYSDTAIDK